MLARHGGPCLPPVLSAGCTRQRAGLLGVGWHPGARCLLALGTHLLPPRIALGVSATWHCQEKLSAAQSLVPSAPLSTPSAGSLPAPEHPKGCEQPAVTPSCLPQLPELGQHGVQR